MANVASVPVKEPWSVQKWCAERGLTLTAIIYESRDISLIQANPEKANGAVETWGQSPHTQTWLLMEGGGVALEVDYADVSRIADAVHHHDGKCPGPQPVAKPVAKASAT